MGRPVVRHLVQRMFQTIAVAGILLAFWGCQSTVVVPIRVQVASNFDLRRYPTLAVLPLVDEDGRLEAETLAPLTEQLRLQLEQVRAFTVLGESATLDALAGEQLTAEAYSDPEKVQAWGTMLGVTAIVTGTVRYYSLLAPEARSVYRYSLQLQRYVRDEQMYLVRSHNLVIDLVVRDATTGETLMERRSSRRAREPQSAISAVVQEIAGSSSMLRELAEAPIRDFVLRIAPHYEFEERYLAR